MYLLVVVKVNVIYRVSILMKSFCVVYIYYIYIVYVNSLCL